MSVTVRRDAVQQCHAEGKRPLNASWKRKKLLTGPDRSDGWDGTGAPDWTVAVRIDHSYAYSCHHRALWSPHHTRIRHRLPLPHEMRRERPLQFFFQVFTWEKNTNGSSSGASLSLSLSLHLQPEACPILFLEPTDPCYDDDDASSQPRDQTIGGSSPPFCHVPSLSFLFFSVCSTRSSFSRFRVDSTIDSPAGGRHTFVPARQQGNHAENFQIQ